MKKGKDYGLLIASMVAIVAIVGLVIMFSGGVTGFAQQERLVVSDMGYTQGFEGKNKAEGSFEGMGKTFGAERVEDKPEFRYGN